METYVVVIAGGAGTRFWPAGRLARPKQLLPIASERTMLAETLARASGLAPPQRTYVVTNRVQSDATRRECPELPPDHVVGEPHMRNTAAAIGLAALLVRRRDPDGVMVVMPADHVIRPQERFDAIFGAAVRRAAAADVLLTVGIEPTGPSTGYGWIERGEPVAEVDGERILRASDFVEKPEAGLASRLYEARTHLWNSGTFVYRAKVILDAIARYMPRHAEILESLDRALERGEGISAEAYERFEKVPVDKGVMEKAAKEGEVEVVVADFDWDDVGSWLAIARLNERDGEENVVRAKHAGVDTRNCVIFGGGDHLVATIGISDMIVVHTEDATLICPKDRAEDVREIVKLLEQKGLREYL